MVVVWIGMMMVPMIMVMIVIMAVRMRVLSCASSNALDMVVVGFLHHAYFVFESQHGLTILAVHTIHNICTL